MAGSNGVLGSTRKVLVAVGGGTLILLGLALMVLPGPGWLTLAAGFALLATEFVWARRALKRAREGAASLAESLGWTQFAKKVRAWRMKDEKEDE